MNGLRYALFLGGLLWFHSLSAQPTPLAEFTVRAGEYDRLNTPVTVYEDELRLSLASADSLRLVELRHDDSLSVPVQWIVGEPSGLTWVLAGKTLAGSTRRFRLYQAPPSSDASSAVAVDDPEGKVTFSLGEQAVLTYQHALAEVPPGVDPIFRRGGFVHPLRSPGGDTLTRIQPPDHYHHYGIWNPWTHTEFEGREIDFWNLVKGQGTVALNGKKVLLYPKNGEGYVYDNIPASVRAIQQLADKNGFTVVASDDPAQFTTDNLAQYDALILSNTNNDIFDTSEQHEAFQNYMQLNQLNPDIHVLLAADLTTVKDDKRAEYPGEIYGNSFPTTWCYTTDGGRQWYTSLGHRSEHYEAPIFMRHILGGIQWVLEE